MWIERWGLEGLLKDTDAFAPCNAMLRLREAERLGDEGNLTAVEIVTRGSNSSVVPGSLRVCWRNLPQNTCFGHCISLKKMCLPGPKPCRV